MSVSSTAAIPKVCCHGCGIKEAPFRCSRCHKVYYCSPECQKSHWKSHKKLCVATTATTTPSSTAGPTLAGGKMASLTRPPMSGGTSKVDDLLATSGDVLEIDDSLPVTLKTDEIKGRYLEASQDLSVGDVIFTDVAALVVHHGDTPLHALQTDLVRGWIQGLPLYQDSQTSPGVRLFLLVIGYFLDSILQEQKYKEETTEKTTTTTTTSESSNGGRQEKLFGGYLGSGWLILRHFYCPLAYLSEMEKTEIIALAYWLLTTMPPELSEILTELQMLQLVTLFRNNSMEMTIDLIVSPPTPTPTRSPTTPTPPPSKSVIQYKTSSLFPLLAMVEHSCTPNAYYYITQLGSQVAVRALRPIEKGENITIAYVPYYLPTLERQLVVTRRYYFCCGCAVCSGNVPDRARAFVCAHCKQGVVSPAIACEKDTTQLKLVSGSGSGSHWTCEQCEKPATSATIAQYLQAEKQFSKEVEAWKVNVAKSSYLTSDAVMAAYSPWLQHRWLHLLPLLYSQPTADRRLCDLGDVLGDLTAAFNLTTVSILNHGSGTSLWKI